MIVWVLIIFINGKPLAVDNIASKANCEGLVTAIAHDLKTGREQMYYSCAAVRKVHTATPELR